MKRSSEPAITSPNDQTIGDQKPGALGGAAATNGETAQQIEPNESMKETKKESNYDQ